MTKQCKNFMERVETKIVNYKPPLFDGMQLDRLYYSAFGDTENANENVLSYGEEIQDQKDVEFNQAYIEALDNCIGYKVVVPGKYSITALYRVKFSKQDASYN